MTDAPLGRFDAPSILQPNSELLSLCSPEQSPGAAPGTGDKFLIAKRASLGLGKKESEGNGDSTLHL